MTWSFPYRSQGDSCGVQGAGSEKSDGDRGQLQKKASATGPVLRVCEPRTVTFGSFHEIWPLAVEAAGIAITLVIRVPAPLRSIADQVIRSASSVAANLAEGHGRTGRDRLHLWRIAYASAKEVDTHLRLLTGAGAVNKTRATRAIEIFDEVRAMTWRLLNPGK
jgi:four helix bundle protein